MKTAGYYVLLIFIIVLFIPLIIVKGCGTPKKDLLEGIKTGKIKVYVHLTQKIQEMNYEDYIRGVLAAEMPASYGIEALKAQAVAARTYANNKIISGGKNLPEHFGADICTDSKHCQAWRGKEEALRSWSKANAVKYWDKISLAVRDTAGQMIYYQGKIADPVFHANSGGMTENSEDAWNGVYVPYLRAVPSPGEESSRSFSSQLEIKANDFIQKIKSESPEINIKVDDIANSIKTITRTKSGRVKNIKIADKNFTGAEMRKIFELKSTNFTIEINREKVIFMVKGYGHGVGLSQCGANSLSQKGMGYKEILKYYYKGVEVK